MRLDGITPILSMPFDEHEQIDLDALCAQVDFLDGSGVRAVGFGFASEIVKLSPDELVSAISTVTSHVNGSLDVMGTVGGRSVREIVEAGEAIAGTGVDVLMMRPPMGVTSLDHIRDCCTELAVATGLPLVIQDAPVWTEVELAADLLAQLVEQTPQIIALKLEPTDPVQKMRDVVPLLGDEVSILGGAGGATFMEELDLGSHGTVPFTVLASRFVRAQELHAAGQREAAQAHFDELMPLLRLCLSGGNQDGPFFLFKELLRRKGVFPSARLRSPAEDVDPRLLSELDLVLAALPGWDEPR